ncbi:MAG TPA: cytochrome c oxidase subunit 3 [Burkholderiales bacterium]|jgi:cytochrome c oxidase subunit 3
MTTSQFGSALERREASLFGMWAFLATELMFFGPLFFGYVHARLAQHDAFVSGSHHMHIALGTLNTAILMTSSLTMALAVRAAQRSGPTRIWLALTALFGLAFLGIKASEWVMEFGEAARAAGGEARFYFLYYAMTGLHAVHLTIGVGVVAWLWLYAKRFSAEYHAPVEVSGLYWHFIDVVWVFLYPMFYLLERYNA